MTRLSLSELEFTAWSVRVRFPSFNARNGDPQGSTGYRRTERLQWAGKGRWAGWAFEVFGTEGGDFGPEARDNGPPWRTAIRGLDLTNPKKVFKFPYSNARNCVTAVVTRGGAR